MLDGALVTALAERHGTPLFVYDGARIRDRIRRLRRGLTHRPLRVLYSAKASPAVALAAFMRREGLGLDVCSPGDLRLAELAGFGADELSYTGFGASDAELVLAAAKAGDLVLDSAEEVARLAALGIARPVGLRVSPGIAAGFHAHVAAGGAAAKFGVAIEELGALAERAGRAGLPVVGLHAHLGSDLLDAAPYVELVALLVAAARSLGSVRWLNLGGGFGTPRRPGQEAFAWTELDRAVRAHLTGSSPPLELRVEPGGYLTMDAGLLVGRVVAVKRGGSGRPDTLVSDASINHLVSVLLYDAHHPVRLLAPDREAPRRRYRIAGNLMQAGDTLAESVELPDARPGDLLAHGFAGAYAACRATTFNERPRAAEVLVDRGVPLLLRRAETIEELFVRDVSPPTVV